MPEKRRKIRGQVVLYYLIVILTYALDQLSKLYIQEAIAKGSSLPIIENFFHITLVYNSGAAFGLLSGYSRLFILVALVAIFVINYVLFKKRKSLRGIERVSLCFILGGTLGNLTDRIRWGYIIDFIDFRIWPVFNLADSFITVGAVMLAWSVFLENNRNKQIEAK